ncbi:MAG: phosphatase [Clostridiales bacterium]
MNFKVDAHTHTIASGHGYSSIEEMTIAAKKKNFEIIVIADHASSIPGAPNDIYFRNLHLVSRKINDVRVLAGVEANIIDYKGNIDINEKVSKKLDYVIASFHDICIKPSSVAEHTEAVINALKNPYIDVIGHPGNPRFQIDIEKFVLACKEYEKPVEMNNHSFKARPGSENNCLEILKLCKKHEVEIVCSSDAHFSADVGNFNKLIEMINDVDIDSNLLLCFSKNSMENYLSKRNKRIKKYQYNSI